ncbi:MAG: hypothetical protein RMJ37_08065 [Spirochaetia bacterium]|nr:hypothetical protein [Spirochaetota bacterium]MDW8113269.1 hypothetical protein [Spirochaetia bacterium]
MLGPNKPRYTKNNVKFDNFAVFLKKYNETTGSFERIWRETGFVSGNANVEWTVSAAELKAGVPRTMVARVINEIDATIRLSFVETDIENISLVLFQQTPNWTNNTTSSNKTYNNIQTSAFQNIPDLSPNPVFLLDSIPVPGSTFTVLDDNGTNVTASFQLRRAKGVPFIERTSATFPGTPPYDITITRYTSIRKDSLIVFEDVSKIGFPYKILIIGRNTINKMLRAIYMPSVVIETPPTIGMSNEDFLRMEVAFKTLAEYPAGTSPLDLNFSPNYMIIRDYESTIDPKVIAEEFNSEVITDLPS